MVGLSHGIVTGVQSLRIGIERICVLHFELTNAQEATTRSSLVTEFGLYLVQDERHVAMTGYPIASHDRDRFLVSRRENHLAFATVGESRKWRDVGICSTTLLPNRTRLNDGHRNFETANGVHLFANNVAYLVQTALSERHDAEDACCDLLDKTAAGEVFVADRLGLYWCLTSRLDVKL